MERKCEQATQWEAREREREEKIKEKELRQGEGVFLSSCALSQRGQ